MQSGPQHAIRTRHRRAFTLMEMLLVLGVLVVAMAMVYPAMMRLAQDQNLLHSVEMVQARLATARVRAARDGLTYQFRFEPNGRKFVVIPEAEVGGKSGSAGTTANSSQSHALYRYSGEVPAGLQFDPGQWVTKGAAPLSADAFEGLEDARHLTGVHWSSPLLFYPDGTSTGGELTVFDARHFQIRFNVRGLTGGVTVSPIERGDKKK